MLYVGGELECVHESRYTDLGGRMGDKFEGIVQLRQYADARRNSIIVFIQGIIIQTEIMNHGSTLTLST